MLLEGLLEAVSLRIWATLSIDIPANQLELRYMNIDGDISDRHLFRQWRLRQYDFMLVQILPVNPAHSFIFRLSRHRREPHIILP